MTAWLSEHITALHLRLHHALGLDDLARRLQQPRHEQKSSEYDSDFWTLLSLLILVAVLVIGVLLFVATW